MQAELRQLRWQCARRGMVEIEIALTGFLDTGYSTLDANEKKTFESLLKTSDTLLYAWFLQDVVPSNKTYIPLLKKIMTQCKLAAVPDSGPC